MGSWTWPDRSSAASWRSSKSPPRVSHRVELGQDTNCRGVASVRMHYEESLPHLQCLPGWGAELLCMQAPPVHQIWDNCATQTMGTRTAFR